MLKQVRPPEHGVIVRTAAEGATEEDLRRPRRCSTLGGHREEGEKGKAPTVLYEEPELTVRVVRDLFTEGEFKDLVTDSRRVYDKVDGYLSRGRTRPRSKVRMHEGPLPVFEEHQVVEQIHKALDRKVWLPSGGYLVIERTEAMTVVDVNTGKPSARRTSRRPSSKTNLEAGRGGRAAARLRDIGGIIIIDFIDMLLERNKEKVIDTMRDALAEDKTRSQVFEIGPLGLMEVTRKRVSAGLLESFSETCPDLRGPGHHPRTYDVQLTHWSRRRRTSPCTR